MYLSTCFDYADFAGVLFPLHDVVHDHPYPGGVVVHVVWADYFRLPLDDSAVLIDVDHSQELGTAHLPAHRLDGED